ncbi:MAG: urease accessory protein UreD [Pyrinomonadaceae bacterium]|nr:urease accessory protein UreD [Pyrinomonadaceae bacterium]
MQRLEAAPAPTQIEQQPQTLYSVSGRLRLIFERGHIAGRTVLAVCEQQPPLKVVRAFPSGDGGTLIHLHNLSGGVLGGDRLEMIAEVGPEARAQLTSTGATRLYRSRVETPAALQINKISVGENGLLEYLPDELIPFAGSRYRQETKIELAQSAGLFWWETVAPGREARGELFDYESLQIKLDITAEGKPLALERIKLEPGKRPLASLVRLGSYRYFSSFYICRVGQNATRWLELEKQLAELARQLTRPSETLWGVSTLAAHGLIVRALSVKGRDIASGLRDFWRAAKLELYGQAIVPPRKVN